MEYVVNSTADEIIKANGDTTAVIEAEKPKVVNVRVKYRPGVMTLNDMCELEMPRSYREIRSLLARHLVDENGRYIEDIEAAQRAIGEVPREHVGDLVNQLWEQLQNHTGQEIDPN